MGFVHMGVVRCAAARIANRFLLRKPVAGIYGREFISVIIRLYPPVEMVASPLLFGALNWKANLKHAQVQQLDRPGEYVRLFP